MGEGHDAKIASRSLVGVMNEFAFLGNLHRVELGADEDLVALWIDLAETPMSPLYKRHISPDHELRALVEQLTR